MFRKKCAWISSANQNSLDVAHWEYGDGFVVCEGYFFIKKTQKTLFTNVIRVQNKLDPDQARCFFFQFWICLHTGKFLTILFCHMLIFFFKIYMFLKNLSETASEYQTVCIQTSLLFCQLAMKCSGGSRGGSRGSLEPLPMTCV